MIDTSRVSRVLLFVAFFVAIGCKRPQQDNRTQIQLNWLHDPTFTGEYALAAQQGAEVSVREGGPNISPISEVMSDRSAFAVVGADIFLQMLDKNIQEGKDADLSCFFVDFQRNPVGWILHPDAARKAGLTDATAADPKASNDWLFQHISDGTIKPGDKRGTETTSVWIQWRKIRKLGNNITVVPVGFDSGVVLSAPMLAYPVYLNEEPYKLAARSGQPMRIFDPAADGVELYGNVLVVKSSFATSHPEVIRSVQRGLREAWRWARLHQPEATARVAKVYSGVAQDVLEQEVRRTIEFVFFGGQDAGTSDTQQWGKTLNALRDAGLVSDKLTIDVVRAHLIAE
jgi:hypothetical protein